VRISRGQLGCCSLLQKERKRERGGTIKVTKFGKGVKNYKKKLFEVYRIYEFESITM
jgi:hypothetical protein